MIRAYTKRMIPFICVILSFVLLFSSNIAMASSNAWYDQYVSYESVYGDDYYTSKDSALLGWGESYVLRGYMNMYEVTKDTTWLDKLVLHTDSIIGNASDPDGDGYLGWTTHRYSPVLISNGTFASATSGDSTLPANWTRFQGSSATSYRSNAPGDYYGTSDSWGLVLKTNTTQWVKMYQNISSYKPNQLYTLEFEAKTNGSAAKGEAYIYDRTTSTIIGTPIVIDNTAWKTYQLHFTAPSVAGHDLEVWLGHDNYTISGGVAYFDNVTVSGQYPYLVHQGFLLTPVAQFIRLINQTPSLQSDYLSKANTYQEFIENEIVPQWEKSSYIGNTWRDDPTNPTSRGWYREPVNFDAFATGTVADPLPYNMLLAFAELLLTMYDVNKNPDYLSKARKINEYFKSKLISNGSALKWSYANYTSQMEDISHGNLDVYTAVDMWNHDQIYTSTEMDGITNALTDYIWNGSLTDPKLHNYVDGTKGSQSSDYIWTKLTGGWTQLAQFDARAWDIAAEQYRNISVTEEAHGLALTEIMKWDPEKVVNRGFELKSSGDDTLPARWNRMYNSSATAYLDETNKVSGKYGLTVSSDLTGWRGVYQVWKEWKPNTTYVLTLDGKTDGNAAGGRFFIKDMTANSIVGSIVDFDNTQWETKTITFTTPTDSSHELRIYLENHTYTVAGKAHFDNIKLVKQGETW